MPQRIFSLSLVPSVSLPHWNYFLAIEDDISRIGRYIELTQANFTAYSIETARLLMAATQEIDVLLKQLCTVKGDSAKEEKGYRVSVPQVYPRIPKAEVQVSPYGLNFTPFESWQMGLTPTWWTANNKVKHERHTNFSEASVGFRSTKSCRPLAAGAKSMSARITYEVRPRKDKRGVNLISDALPFRSALLWRTERYQQCN